MSKETLGINISNLGSETPASSEAKKRQRLVASVRRLGKLIEHTESSVSAPGSEEAEGILIENIPALGSISNGDLKAVRHDNQIEARIASLTPGVVSQTQEQIDALLGISLVVRDLVSARRLEPYLPVTLPKTRAGLETLRLVASEVNGLGNIPKTVKVLDMLDKELRAAGLKDEDITSALNVRAREQAQARLERSKIEGSSQISQIRAAIAERKMSELRREHVQVGNKRDHSKFEILALEIIERENLKAEVELAKARAREASDKAKEETLIAIARRRAITTVMGMLGTDTLLSQEVARRQRMSVEALLDAEDGTKKLAANNILSGRKVILSVEERRVFNGQVVIDEERDKLIQALEDPLNFIARLTDEELEIIRHRVPKTSDSKAIFDLARERLKTELENEITEEEVLKVLIQQTVRELLQTRSSMAVDLAIRDLGINSSSILEDPSILSKSEERIVVNALNYLQFDRPPLRLPNVEVEGFNEDESLLALGIDSLRCLTEKNVIDLLERLAQSPDIYGVKIENRGEVKIYMIDEKARETLIRMSKFLADLSNISDVLLLPETEDEMSCLLTMIVDAIAKGEALTLVTPICPDWSRDSEGRYDFKSLGGGKSFIATKLLTRGRDMLAVFAKHQIPFKGILLFADWGLETEINAKDTYGQKLSAEDVQMCFSSTVAATDEHLRALQSDKEVGHLFEQYSIVSMREFLEKRLDIPQVKARLEQFFINDRRGKALLDILAAQSYKINRMRLGLTEEENRSVALQNLVEYSTVGQSIGPHSILVACESRITSRAYNLPRKKHENIPVFFVKGKEGIDRGVNIL